MRVIAECVACEVKGSMEEIEEHFITREHLDAVIAMETLRWERDRAQRGMEEPRPI